MIEDLEKTRNDIPDLSNLSVYRYENIFKIGKNNNFYFYNILKNIKFPANLELDLYYTKVLTSKMPYTTISQQEYGTQDLWWLIVLSNKLNNPVQVPPAGISLKIIKRKYIKNIIDAIKSLNNV